MKGRVPRRKNPETSCNEEPPHRTTRGLVRRLHRWSLRTRKRDRNRWAVVRDGPTPFDQGETTKRNYESTFSGTTARDETESSDTGTDLPGRNHGRTGRSSLSTGTKTVVQTRLWIYTKVPASQETVGTL